MEVDNESSNSSPSAEENQEVQEVNPQPVPSENDGVEQMDQGEVIFHLSVYLL